MEYLQKIQRAVDFIEAHLGEELTVDAITRVACLSRWHFQVIFHAMVGDTLAEYIRKRRLTAAAIALGTTRERVIEIALVAGFGSQAAFTRAFKAQFRQPPGAYRLHGISRVMLGHKPKITRSYLNHLYANITMKPVFKKFPKTKVIGLQARFIAGTSPETNSKKIIGQLWGEFMMRGFEIMERSQPANFGVTIRLKDSDKKSHPDEMLYLAGAPVKPAAKPPKGMTEVIIPAGNYAVFTHRGPMEEIGRTMNYIYGSWLPKSGKTLRDVPHLGISDKRFKMGSPDSEFDVCVPVD